MQNQLHKDDESFKTFSSFLFLLSLYLKFLKRAARPTSFQKPAHLIQLFDAF